MSYERQSQYDMRDPRDLYPQPNFPKQPQEAPGLSKEMEPQPDHGERSYVGKGRLPNRHALITGGDSGLGRAAAIAYLREGAEVTINYLPEEEADVKSLRILAKEEELPLHTIAGDIKEKAFCRELVQQAKEHMGGLDILVLNAGKQVFQAEFSDISDEQFDATMKTNVYAMFWLTKEALPLLPAGASIINVSSIQAYQPSPTLIDYATTKFAIRGFTQALAQTAMNQGVRVNAIAPGPFWTPLQPSGGQSQEKVQSFGANTPIGRPGQPAELAPAFVFLASQESSYISGEVIGATGGRPMH